MGEVAQGSSWTHQSRECVCLRAAADQDRADLDDLVSTRIGLAGVGFDIEDNELDVSPTQDPNSGVVTG
ncbi:MAG: hypothetical protein OXD37_10190 [Acidimicrobiaceae bacterium]|nr:hypothetical protein [Acidimicrobiaceae bacterium]